MSVVGEQLLLAVALYESELRAQTADDAVGFNTLPRTRQAAWRCAAAELINDHRPKEPSHSAEPVDGLANADEAGAVDEPLKFSERSDAASPA